MLADPGWELKAELPTVDPARCVSVGFLLEDRRDAKVLIGTDSTSQVLGRIAIPTRDITRLTRLA